MRTSDRRHGSVGEMYANQRHMMILGGGEFSFSFFCVSVYGTIWDFCEVKSNLYIHVLRRRGVALVGKREQ